MTNRGAPWKCRAVENEENQNQVSLVSHRPWKSLRDFHIPTAPMTSSYSDPKNEPKIQRKEPGIAPARFLTFRLILGLENAVTVQCHN